MLFKYYVTSLFDGKITGLNGDEEAESLSHVEEFFVVDSSTGEWISHGERTSIEEFRG